MKTEHLPRLLCVDDEPNVLDGLLLHLGRRFDTTSATSAASGLEIIQRTGEFALVISDMRMPEINGAQFLARVRQLAPRTVRILLTGQTDLDSAIAAVNDGQIFRFLSKPCPPERLLKAADDAVEQYSLITAERELLEQTLMGSLATLSDVLALANPEAFGRATRVRNYVSELAAEYDLPSPWQMEAAAMLSQIGSITLGAEIAAKLNRGRQLSAEEERLVAQVPQVTERLLRHIPRLEGVRAILAGTSRPVPGSGRMGSSTNPVVLGTGILRIALDFDRLEGRGMPLEEALALMQERTDLYDRDILERFSGLRRREGGHGGVVEIPLAAVRVGMVFVEDVKMRSGVLLARRGYVVTEAFVERARNSQAGGVVEPVRCLAPDAHAGPVQKDGETTCQTR